MKSQLHRACSEMAGKLPWLEVPWAVLAITMDWFFGMTDTTSRILDRVVLKTVTTADTDSMRQNEQRFYASWGTA